MDCSAVFEEHAGSVHPLHENRPVKSHDKTNEEDQPATSQAEESFKTIAGKTLEARNSTRAELETKKPKTGNALMLPTHIAENIKKQVLFYLQSTFSFRDKAVEKAFNRFLTRSGGRYFQRPLDTVATALSPGAQRSCLPF